METQTPDAWTGDVIRPAGFRVDSERRGVLIEKEGCIGIVAVCVHRVGDSGIPSVVPYRGPLLM